MKKFSQDENSFKELSFKNWLEIDETSRIKTKHKKENKFISISEAEWFEKLHHTKVEFYVPTEIQNLVEFTRGTMTYGYFYYPIIFLAFEQLFNIIDTAIKKRCTSLQAPKSKITYKLKINWLLSQGAISKESYNIWERVLQLRDLFSQPQKQNIIPPNIILQTVNSLIVLINDLYNEKGKYIVTVITGYILTYENIPFSGFAQNGSKVIFNKEPYLFNNLPDATKMRTRLKLVIKDINDVEGLEKIITPINLEIEKIYKKNDRLQFVE